MNVDDLLMQARSGLARVAAPDAQRRQTAGALLVDIRPIWMRERDGEIPGSIVIERNHLEWRLDPTSPARIPEAVDHDIDVIVVCQSGFTSSLAAAALQELGMWRATDLIGGYDAWQAAGLPTVPGGGMPRLPEPQPR